MPISDIVESKEWSCEQVAAYKQRVAPLQENIFDRIEHFLFRWKKAPVWLLWIATYGTIISLLGVERMSVFEYLLLALFTAYMFLRWFGPGLSSLKAKQAVWKKFSVCELQDICDLNIHVDHPLPKKIVEIRGASSMTEFELECLEPVKVDRHPTHMILWMRLKPFEEVESVPVLVLEDFTQVIEPV